MTQTTAIRKTGLWRRTPPAIFPPILGLFGLGLAFRRAAEVFSIPVQLSDLILGAVTLLYLFAVLAYLAKVLRRPTVVAADARVLPGRAGLAAGTMAGMLLASVLLPFDTRLAAWVLGLALAANLGLALLVIRSFLTGPAEQRRVTPVWHLTFVGPIVAPLAGVPLGWTRLSEVIFFACLAIAVYIWGASARQFQNETVPPPLRPLLAIHLAPMCLFGLVSDQLGYDTTSLVMALAAIVVIGLFIWRKSALTAAGFSPLWGAFTFPLAAFANLMLVQSQTALAFALIGAVALVAATMIIVWIAVKVVKMWASGMLAAKTNAAEA